MNVGYFHLLLNHIPVLGVLFGLGIQMAALIRGSTELRRLALWIFVLAALSAVPAFLTGEPAEDKVKGLPGVTEQAIESHEEFASVALGGIILLGAVALGGLAAERLPRARKSAAVAVLLCAFISAGLLVRTAQLGGQIRHTEFRPAAAALHGAGLAVGERENGAHDD